MLPTSMPYAEPEQALMPVETGPREITWPGVAQGLTGILIGHFLVLGNVVLSVLLVIGVLFDSKRAGKLVIPTGDAATVLFAGMLVIGLLSLFSAWVLLRGQWICLRNAPERQNCKWWMFASMLCICAGPTINFATGFFEATAKRAKGDNEVVMVKSVTDYTKKMREQSIFGYIRFAGAIIPSLAVGFFAMFLRAIANCLGSSLGARLVEAYLVFYIMLTVGSFSMLFELDNVIKQPHLLVCMGVGWLIAGAWYLLMIFIAICGIQAATNGRS